VGNTPAGFRQMIGPQIDKWRNLVKIPGAKVD